MLPKLAGHTIIVAPLNWGLGHASRCIPLIKHLLVSGNKIILACDGLAGQLLQKEFPDLEYHDIDSPEIRYTFQSMAANAFVQLPNALRHYKIDRKASKVIIDITKADIIISDNRFGFYDDRCKNIYITHQLSIKAGSTLTTYFANLLHHRVINNFTECWVPDYEDEGQKIAGQLSVTESKTLVKPIIYIGPLTRMVRHQIQKDIDILIVLSGPEPQRTILEKRLLDIDFGHLKVMMVRGTADNPASNITFDYQNIADSLTINTLLNRSKTLITRSGYSTLMDIEQFDIKAILIPTPGQYEQEYLANYMHLTHHQKYSVCLQSNIDQNLLNIIESNTKA